MSDTINISKFAGINNVLPSHRLADNEMTVATDVNIGISGELSRRDGFTRVSATPHTNVHQGDGFVLAVVNGDLVKTTGTTQTVLYTSLGFTRVWYVNLPDGRTAFSNGLINGITNGTAVTEWGTPRPSSLGAATDVAGSLFPGDYQYALTYVRNSDGLESAPLFSNPVTITSGGILLTGLPVMAGYTINVYLSGVNGGAEYFAVNTAGPAASYTGVNSSLVLPLRPVSLMPMPVGTISAMWRGRVLVAQGDVLWASELHQPELHNPAESFKQFSADITLIQPMDTGIFVGTKDELMYLSGVDFADLTYTQKVKGEVVLGSGVSVRGELIKRGQGVGEGSAMICIADKTIVAGFSDGNVERLTEGRYQTSVTEVHASFRMIDKIPQYVAIPR